MKSGKTILLMLACIWTVLLLIEKIFNTAGSIKVRNLSLPRKIVHHAVRLFKSAPSYFSCYCKCIYGDSPH